MADITTLTEDTSPGSDSVIYTVDDPAGTPADRKVALSNLYKALSKTGADTTLVSGTAGTDGNVVSWNIDGDAVDSGTAITDVLKSTDIGGTVQGYDADTAKLDTMQAWTKQQYFATATISSSGGTLIWNLDDGQVAKTTLTENVTTLTLDGTRQDGAFYTLRVIQGAGPYTISWPATVKWPDDVAPALDQDNGGTDVFSFVCDGTNLYGGYSHSIGTDVQAYNATLQSVATNGISKSIIVESPTSSEDISFFFTNAAITVTEMRCVMVGTTPSVTWTIRHGTDRSAAGAEVVTGGTTTTSTTTGDDVTSFNDATIVADSHVWLETTAKSGTVTNMIITVVYTMD